MILKLNLHSPRQNLLNLSHSVTLNEVFPQLCTSSIIFFIFLEPEESRKEMWQLWGWVLHRLQLSLFLTGDSKIVYSRFLRSYRWMAGSSEWKELFRLIPDLSRKKASGVGRKDIPEHWKRLTPKWTRL